MSRLAVNSIFFCAADRPVGRPPDFPPARSPAREINGKNGELNNERHEKNGDAAEHEGDLDEVNEMRPVSSQLDQNRHHDRRCCDDDHDRRNSETNRRHQRTPIRLPQCGYAAVVRRLRLQKPAMPLAKFPTASITTLAGSGVV